LSFRKLQKRLKGKNKIVYQNEGNKKGPEDNPRRQANAGGGGFKSSLRRRVLVSRPVRF